MWKLWAVVLTAAVAVSAAEVDLSRFYIKGSGASLLTENNAKVVLLTAKGAARVEAGYALKVKPGEKYVLTVEFEGKELKELPSKSLKGAGISLVSEGKILYRGSHLGMWKHALGTFPKQTIRVPFKAGKSPDAYLYLQIADATGSARYYSVKLDPAGSAPPPPPSLRADADGAFSLLKSNSRSGADTMDGKQIKLTSSDRSAYALYKLGVEPFHKYEFTAEMRGSNIVLRPSKSVRGAGIYLSRPGESIYRGSHLGMWKHAQGTFDWQKIRVVFNTKDYRDVSLYLQISDASGEAEFRNVRLKDITPVKKKIDIRGVVYQDANGNGKQDAGEKGFSGVQVSDGLQIVSTGSDGSFLLPGSTGKWVFAVKPDNGKHTTPYCVPAAPRVSFGLQTVPATDRVVFYSVNDSETGNALGFIGDIAAAVKKFGGDFLVHCGDIGYMPGHKETMTKAGLPVYYVIGNHDFHKSPAGGESDFEKLFGSVYYSFNHGGMHFIVLAYFGGVDVPPSAELERNQLQWLKRDLAWNPRPTVVFRHHPMRFRDNVTKLLLAPGTRVVATISGHTHATQSRILNGVLAAECAPPEKAGTDHSPQGFLCGIGEKGKLNLSVINSVAFRPSPAVDPKADAVKMGDNWPQFRKDALRSGRSAQKIAAPLRLRWKFKAPGRIYACSPILFDGRIYIATLDDAASREAAVLALDARSGKLLWKNVLGNSVKNTLATDGKRVYGVCVDGTAFALDARSGKLLWRTVIPYNVDRSEGTYGPATLYAGRLWVGSDHIAELDPATGKLLREDDKRNVGSPCHAAPVIDGKRIYSTENWRMGVYAHDLATGKRLWRTGRENGAYTFLDPGPCFADGKLYQRVNGGVRLLDPATGKTVKVWKEKESHKGFETYSAPLAADGTLYAAGATGVYALDGSSLQLKWSFRPGKEMMTGVPYSHGGLNAVYASPALVPGALLFGAGDGLFYVLSPESGKVLQSVDCGAPFFGSPAVSGNTVVTAAADGTVYAFTGSTK